jgi:hypothetical protein
MLKPDLGSSSSIRESVLNQIDEPAGRVMAVRDIITSEQVWKRGAMDDVRVPGWVLSKAAY